MQFEDPTHDYLGYYNVGTDDARIEDYPNAGRFERECSLAKRRYLAFSRWCIKTLMQ